jgi:DnaJ-class molecular chaperone
MHDPYQVLGLTSDATDKDIKTKYRALAKELHPDRHPGNEIIADKFKEISAAYNQLNSKNRARTDFDRRRSNSTKNEGATATGANRAAGMAGEDFHKYYDDASQRAYKTTAEEEALLQSARASDYAAVNYAAEKEEIQEPPAPKEKKKKSSSWFGASKKDEKPRKSFSDFLGGFGSPEIPELTQAGSLNIGQNDAQNSSGLKEGDVEYTLAIPFMEAVKGSTRRVDLPTGKTLDVTIAPGVRDGQTIRLRGQGNVPKLKSAVVGDALIEIEVEPHDHFMRDGLDIFLDLPITLAEALLGAKVKVPTVDGPVTMTIPENADSGQSMRLKGKGVSRLVNGTREVRGDQYVTLVVKMPPATSDLLRQAVEEEYRNAPYKVRQEFED